MVEEHDLSAWFAECMVWVHGLSTWLEYMTGAHG